MLDKKTEAVLSVLAEKVGYSYKVFTKKDLADAVPKKYGVDVEGLVNIINFLKQNDYAVVKYEDKDEICLTLTAKAETYLAGVKETAVKSKIAGGQAWILFAGAFVAAFLGALAAVLLGKLF